MVDMTLNDLYSWYQSISHIGLRLPIG